MLILLYLAIAGVLTTTVLALWKGGPAERWAVVWYFGACLAQYALMPKNNYSPFFSYALLLGDLLIAAGFLVLALRYSSLWLAGAMIAQGLASGAHGFHLEDEQMNQHLLFMGANVWVLANNLFSSFVFWMLLGGTIATWRKRNRLRRAARESAKLVADALSSPGRTVAAA